MKRRKVWLSRIGYIFLLVVAATVYSTPFVAADNNRDLSININTADAAELKSLPGIGGAKASAIIEYRSKNGPFKSVEELTNISGISSRILDKIRDLIRTE